MHCMPHPACRTHHPHASRCTRTRTGPAHLTCHIDSFAGSPSPRQREGRRGPQRGAGRGDSSISAWCPPQPRLPDAGSIGRIRSGSLCLVMPPSMLISRACPVSMPSRTTRTHAGHTAGLQRGAPPSAPFAAAHSIGVEGGTAHSIASPSISACSWPAHRRHLLGRRTLLNSLRSSRTAIVAHRDHHAPQSSLTAIITHRNRRSPRSSRTAIVAHRHSRHSRPSRHSLSALSNGGQLP